MTEQQKRIREYLLGIVKPNGVYHLSIKRICRICGTDRKAFKDDIKAIADIPTIIKRGKTTIYTHNIDDIAISKNGVLTIHVKDIRSEYKWICEQLKRNESILL